MNTGVKIVITVIFVIMIGLLTTGLFTGCTVKFVPFGSASQAELNRRIAIDSYKEGICDGVEAMEIEQQRQAEEPNLIPW